MPPYIDRFSPASGGWAGGIKTDGTRFPGTLLVITGRNFHSTPEMSRNQVSFAGPGGIRINAPVIWASPNEIHYSPSPDGVFEDPGGLPGPEGIAVRGNALYVAVTGENTVKQGPSPTFWVNRVFPDTPPRRFDRPSGIATDDTGNVYVANTGLHRIEKYGPALEGLGLAWGSQGAGNGQFQFPRAVDAVMIAGRTYVFIADTANRRVVRTREDGSDFRIFAMPPGVGTIQGVAAHAAGDVYCSDLNNHRILHFDVEGTFLGEFGVDELNHPLGLDVDFDGFIYVADNGSRTIKKFGTDFRLLAEFGLTTGSVPFATPPEELVDPVDVAVGSDKAVWIADRRRNHIVRWFPMDAQEIWVTIPEGAISGQLLVETDSGSDGTQFRVFQTGAINVLDTFVTQGIEEYPLVAGKRTGVIVKMTAPIMDGELVSYWGSPLTDRSEIEILRDGSLLGSFSEFQSFGADVRGSTEAIFHLLFEVPDLLVFEPGTYEFRITFERPGLVSYNNSITKEVRRRQSLKIGAFVLSHLRPDGTMAADGDIPTDSLLIWLGDDSGTLSWLDWNTVLSGFANFNRLFPSRHSFTNIEYLRPILVPGLPHGITDFDVKNLLSILEGVRDGLNEDGAGYDFLIGIVNREFTRGWNGITAADSGWRTALISFGRNMEDPIQDMGMIIAHEIAHQFGLVQPGPRFIGAAHSKNEFVQTSKSAWHSLLGFLDANPRSVMFDQSLSPIPLDDSNAFFELNFPGEPHGDYWDLFDALANPHPPRRFPREVPCDSSPEAPKRPEGSSKNFTLIGSIHRDGRVRIHYRWVGSPKKAVSPLLESDYQVVFVGEKDEELLRWPVSVGFELTASEPEGHAKRHIQEWGGFRVTAPWPNATSKVRLEHRDHVLTALDVPRLAPTVRILSPQGGERLGIDDVLEIRWTATHPDGAPLTYRVEYSPDSGASFKMIQHCITDTNLSWDHRLFPGSGQATIRVIASEGFLSSSAVSPPFIVARKPPQLRILWPRNGESIPEGRLIRMAAIARDPEQGSLGDDSISWYLDGLISLGRGMERQLREITTHTPRGELRRVVPVGEHTLTARGLDRDGNMVEDTISITIAADSDGDGYTDEEERARGTDPNDPLDNPGNLHQSPFGQWQVNRAGLWTQFEISNLTFQRSIVEITLTRQDGHPLCRWPVAINEGGVQRAKVTDSIGRFHLDLCSQGSAAFELRWHESSHAEELYGHGMIRLVAALDAMATTIVAQGWICQDADYDGEIKKFANGRSVIVHGGEAFILRSPHPTSSRPRATKPLRFQTIKQLGNLIQAAGKGIFKPTPQEAAKSD